jgi:hypothetical protein
MTLTDRQARLQLKVDTDQGRRVVSPTLIDKSLFAYSLVRFMNRREFAMRQRLLYGSLVVFVVVLAVSWVTHGTGVVRGRS